MRLLILEDHSCSTPQLHPYRGSPPHVIASHIDTTEAQAWPRARPRDILLKRPRSKHSCGSRAVLARPPPAASRATAVCIGSSARRQQLHPLPCWLTRVHPIQAESDPLGRDSRAGARAVSPWCPHGPPQSSSAHRPATPRLTQCASAMSEGSLRYMTKLDEWPVVARTPRRADSL